MATVNQIIARSLRMLTVLDHQESMTAVQSANGLTVLNAMLARWEEDGIALGWSAQTSGSATAPIPDSADTAVAANLASQYGLEFGIAIPAGVMALAMDGKAALERDSIKNTIEPRPTDHLPASQSGSPFNINTGE